MKKRVAAVLLSVLLIGALSACNLADLELGGLVGELLGGNEQVVPGQTMIPPDVNLDDQETWIEETWIEETWTAVDNSVPVPDLNPDAYRGHELVILGTNAVDLGHGDDGNDIVSMLSYTRNEIMGGDYGIKIVSVEMQMEELPASVKTDVHAGTGEYHLVYAGMYLALPELATGGYLHSLYDLPYVDLTSDAWDQGIRQGLAIGDYLPMATGAITPDATLKTSLLLYNSQIADNIGLDMYAYAAYGDWTMDKMYGICEVVCVDLNSDGTWSPEHDRLGFVGTYSCAQAFAVGMNAQVIGKEESNLPVQEDVEVLENAYARFYNLVTMHGSYYLTQREYLQSQSSAPAKCFADGRALLLASNVQGALEMLNSGVTYGILPYPKLDVSQDQYCSYVDSMATAVMVPVSVDGEKLELVGFVLEAMAQTSQNLYYEKLGMRVASSDKDMDIFKMIWHTKTMDFGCNYFITSDPSVQCFMRAMEENQATVAVLIRQQSKALQKSLAKLIEDVKR